jgi:hypothetical protein
LIQQLLDRHIQQQASQILPPKQEITTPIHPNDLRDVSMAASVNGFGPADLQSPFSAFDQGFGGARHLDEHHGVQGQGSFAMSPAHTSPFIHQSPAGAPGVSMTPEAAPDSASGRRKRQRRSYADSPDLYPQNDHQLQLLLQAHVHNSSTGAQENVVPYQSDAFPQANPQESHQAAAVPYNTPGSFSLSPQPRPVLGESRVKTIIGLDMNNWSTTDVYNDFLAGEIHTLLDMQPREMLHLVLQWVLRHQELPPYFAVRLVFPVSLTLPQDSNTC